MQRMFPLKWFCALLVLYVSVFADATAEPLPVEKPAPHIALLLPVDSPAFGAAAEAVHQGVLAAAGLPNQGMPVRVYSNYDETRGVVAAYKNAVASGAVAVIGPLTRSGVRQLADEKTIPVPTLALNVVEGPTPQSLYFFGMAVEAEARQIAALARKRGFKQAIVLTARSPLSQRLQFAFEEQWTAAGGTILREIEYTGDTMIFADIVPTPDTMAFFATDVENTRMIRPYLPNSMTAYATSQLFTGNRDSLLNFDFQDIHFVDMPWLLEDQQAYPRASPSLSTDNDRLYALGIDAYRLIKALMSGQLKTTLPLKGVTGRIRLNGQIFTREALPAIFVQGRGQSADAPVAPVTQMFPDQFKNTPQAASGVSAKP